MAILLPLGNSGSGAILQAIPVFTNIQTLSFSEDGTALRTDRGLILTKFSSVVSSQQSPHRGLFVKEQWIATETENILWLPPEYRTGVAAVYGKTVAIGTTSEHSKATRRRFIKEANNLVHTGSLHKDVANLVELRPSSSRQLRFLE